MRYLFLSIAVLLALPSISHAGYREEFEKGFLTKTWAGQQIEENACISCHSSENMKPEFREIVDSWQQSWHAQNNISCQDCHGGDSKDATLAMSRQRGFAGIPSYNEVPAFCGKCHVGILSKYIESDHGKALQASKKAPNCVTCHGSHNIQKASINIINEQLCTRCHSYERARIMKQALFLTEKKFTELEQNISDLKHEGFFADENERALFSTQADFRALFHTVDVSLVKEKTDDVTAKLDQIDKDVRSAFRELRFRRNFSAFLMLAFAGMGIIIFLLSLQKEK